jgi:fructose-1,6-bisphosphatase II
VNGSDGGSADSGCLCASLAGVTEAAALAAGRWTGRGDPKAADAASIAAMRDALDALPISARVVIAEAEVQRDAGLPEGATVGAGGRALDIAVDPLEGAGLVARGQGGAMSIMAVGASNSILSLPQMYMKKLVVGPRAAGRVDIDAPVADTMRVVAEACERRIGDVTAIMLDRPRHEDLLEALQRAGVRVKLISDGDITASIAAAVDGTGDHVYIGVGGTAEGVITAAAMLCLGGEIQAKLWPLSRRQVEAAQAKGVEDIETTMHTGDLVRGDVIVAATGVTRGEFLRGVEYDGDDTRTHSIVLCTGCRHVRFMSTIHLRSGKRRPIRL